MEKAFGRQPGIGNAVGRKRQNKSLWWSSGHDDDVLGDKGYVAEMDRRFKEMESGGVKLYTLAEAESLALQ